jgi:hypothetical protein
MTEIKTIKARHRDGTIESCSIEILSSPHWALVFSGLEFQRREFSGRDLFEALISLRATLEPNGVQLLCAGARVDVFPSGMSRDMGGGRKAYITKLGCPADRSDLVDIFDFCDSATIGSVSDQEAFHAKWTVSLRKTKSETITPFPGEIAEAMHNPNGWVYRIAGHFGPNHSIPKEAIVGAWKVDSAGKIVGDFVKNGNYDPIKWPAGQT